MLRVAVLHPSARCSVAVAFLTAAILCTSVCTSWCWIVQRLKKRQKEVRDKRHSCVKVLEDMKNSLKKLRKDTDDLLKMQQTNLSTMGRKLA